MDFGFSNGKTKLESGKNHALICHPKTLDNLFYNSV